MCDPSTPGDPPNRAAPELVREDGDLFAAVPASPSANGRPMCVLMPSMSNNPSDTTRAVDPFRLDGCAQVEGRTNIGFQALEHCGLLLPAENLLRAEAAAARAVRPSGATSSPGGRRGGTAGTAG